MEIKNISHIQTPYKEGDLTEIYCIDECLSNPKEDYSEQFFMDKNRNIKAQFVTYKNNTYYGNATQLSQFRDNIFIYSYDYDNNTDKHKHRIIKVQDDEYTTLGIYDYIEHGVEDNSFVVKKNGLTGFINIDGEEFIEPQYLSDNSFSCGVCIVQSKNKKWGLINKQNELLIPAIYDDCKAWHFLDGYVVFHNFDSKTSRNKSYIYNFDFKPVQEYDGTVFNLGYGFLAFETEKDVFEVRKLNKTEGNNPTVKDILEISEHYDEEPVVKIICKNEHVFLDESGIIARFNNIKTQDAEQLSPKHKDLFLVSNSKGKEEIIYRWDVVQVKNGINNVIQSFESIDIIRYEEPYSVKKNGLYGYMNSDANIIIEPEYKAAREFKDGIALVCKNGFWGAINKNNEIVVPFEYVDTDTMDFVDGYCAFRLPLSLGISLWHLFNLKGEIVAENNGEIKNLGYGNFAFEKNSGIYEIRNINNER